MQTKRVSGQDEFCVDPGANCDVRLSRDGDAPWMDTQDLQFFADGGDIRMRPLRVGTMFDGGASGARLSDHDVLLVTCELGWPKSAKDGSAC